MKVRDEEIFGPVVLIDPYDDFEDALAQVNHSKYGLQAGLLTRDSGRILTAYRELEVGALIVGDTPSWRLDPMPLAASRIPALAAKAFARHRRDDRAAHADDVVTGIGRLQSSGWMTGRVSAGRRLRRGRKRRYRMSRENRLSFRGKLRVCQPTQVFRSWERKIPLGCGTAAR